ncbi:hypothetical protein HAZT_HAZT007305 [Hyalella azteca]|uniref:Uncharacterized protein n=1 Tax=Hyalella azteca TaxID=294128 RepID=A0A6A0GV01_HYAAZ|nr:hypothetical protein HAZT_HAZT007305 [Hyalella azteca]
MQAKLFFGVLMALAAISFAAPAPDSPAQETPGNCLHRCLIVGRFRFYCCDNRDKVGHCPAPKTGDCPLTCVDDNCPEQCSNDSDYLERKIVRAIALMETLKIVI